MKTYGRMEAQLQAFLNLTLRLHHNGAHIHGPSTLFLYSSNRAGNLATALKKLLCKVYLRHTCKQSILLKKWIHAQNPIYCFISSHILLITVNFIHHLKSLPPHSLPSLLSFNAFTMHTNSGKYVNSQACNSYMFHANTYPVHANLQNAAYQYGTKTYVYSYECFKLVFFTIVTPSQMLS